MSSVTKDPGVSSILLFSGSGINFPRPLYARIPRKVVSDPVSFLVHPIRIETSLTIKRTQNVLPLFKDIPVQGYSLQINDKELAVEF